MEIGPFIKERLITKYLLGSKSKLEVKYIICYNVLLHRILHRRNTNSKVYTYFKMIYRWLFIFENLAFKNHPVNDSFVLII
jgi:hypothetical protein